MQIPADLSLRSMTNSHTLYFPLLMLMGSARARGCNAARSDRCEPIDGGDCTAAEVAAVTGLIGGAGGAAVGLGVGFAIPVWRLRFP